MEARVDVTDGLSVLEGNSLDDIGNCLESTTGGARGWVLLLLVVTDIMLVGGQLDVGNCSRLPVRCEDTGGTTDAG